MLLIIAVAVLTVVCFGFLISIFWEIFKQICAVVYWGIFGIYQYFAVTRPMEKSGFLKKKELEQKLIEAEKANKHKEQILAKENLIISRALSAVRELRIKYPYANEDLFQRFLKKFNVMSLEEMDNMEKEIKKSHESNEVTFCFNSPEEHNYTLADLNGLEPLEERREDPIIMRVYKLNNDHILHIKDIDRNTSQLLHSRDYLVTARAMKQVAEQQKNLRIEKQNIQSEEIESIFKNVVNSTGLFRKNRMNFLD